MYAHQFEFYLKLETIKWLFLSIFVSFAVVLLKQFTFQWQQNCWSEFPKSLQWIQMPCSCNFNRCLDFRKINETKLHKAFAHVCHCSTPMTMSKYWFLGRVCKLMKSFPLFKFSKYLWYITKLRTMRKTDRIPLIHEFHSR